VTDWPDKELNLLMARELGPLVVVKQVCTHPDWRRRGIAGQLYRAVLKHEGDRQVVAAVVSDPPNPASERFHHAMGFEPHRKQTPGDGLERTVWLHKGYSTQLLVKQYKYAVDLYKHEDSLTGTS
jgi:predicted GNAT superfamily acetyltransferase